MEWYWALAIIVVFFGLLVGAYLLIRAGKLNASVVSTAKGVLDGLSVVSQTVKASLPSDVAATFSTIVELLRSGVYAAENMYYNKEIAKDEREAKCLEIFDDLCKASEIELTDAQRGVLHSLIQAMCEEMGHKNEVILN